MRTLERNKRRLYICKKYEDNGLIKYEPPVELYDNYTPTNSESDLMGIGMTYPMYLRIKTDIQNVNRYAPGDRLYVYKDKPLNYDPLAKDCDYIVLDTPLSTINQVEVTLKRLSDSQ